jgi:hypothetical protein
MEKLDEKYRDIEMLRLQFNSRPCIREECTEDLRFYQYSYHRHLFFILDFSNGYVGILSRLATISIEMQRQDFFKDVIVDHPYLSGKRWVWFKMEDNVLQADFVVAVYELGYYLMQNKLL